MKARFILFTLVFGLSTTQASFANSLSEAKDYCESLDVAGLAQEEASQVINDCIEEQSQYISEQESDFEQEPQDIDCYQEAESFSSPAFCRERSQAPQLPKPDSYQG